MGSASITGLGVDAHHAARGVLPERHVVLPEAELRLHQVGRVGHQPRGHLHEGAADVQRVEIAGRFLRLALQPLADDALGALGDVGHGAAELRRVGHLEAGGSFGVLSAMLGVLSVLSDRAADGIGRPAGPGG